MNKDYSKKFFQDKGKDGGLKSRENMRRNGSLKAQLEEARRIRAEKLLTKKTVPPTLDS